MRGMEPVFKSLGHEKRLRILDWLKDPEKHFPPQKDGDLVEDGLYQGVIFESGSMVNLYDKFPGPGDTGADEPIDVDMDGQAEFTPVDGSPGTFTYDGGEITFH